MLREFLNRLDRLAREVRPWMPFTAINAVWRKLDKDSKTILDAGCGRGETMIFINRNGQFYTVGADIFEPYLREASRNSIHDDYVLCDIRKLPFKDNSFDVVLTLGVLEHLDRQDGMKLIGSMEQVARKQVIIDTPAWRYKQGPYNGNPYHEHRYIWSSTELKEIGYKVRVFGIRNIGGAEGLLSRLPQIIRPFVYILWVVAGPFVYFFPRLAGDMVAEKRVKTFGKHYFLNPSFLKEGARAFLSSRSKEQAKELAKKAGSVICSYFHKV